MKRVVMCLLFVSVFGFTAVSSAADAPAKAPKKVASAKSVKSAKKKSAPKAEAVAAEPSPAEVQSKAIASCQKHVESMLHESAETRFSEPGDTKVQPATDEAFDVAGRVSSKTNNGAQRQAGYNCHAKRYGTLWTTKTSLAWDQ